MWGPEREWIEVRCRRVRRDPTEAKEASEPRRRLPSPCATSAVNTVGHRCRDLLARDSPDNEHLLTWRMRHFQQQLFLSRACKFLGHVVGQNGLNAQVQLTSLQGQILMPLRLGALDATD